MNVIEAEGRRDSIIRFTKSVNNYFGEVHNWDYNNLTPYERNILSLESFNILKKHYQVNF